MGRRVLRERHVLACPCSICTPLCHAGVRSFGLLTPLDTSWNSWRWFFIVTRHGITYLRWPGFWKRASRWKR